MAAKSFRPVLTHLHPRQIAELDRLARSRRVPKTKLVRTAIDEYLERARHVPEDPGEYQKMLMAELQANVEWLEKLLQRRRGK